MEMTKQNVTIYRESDIGMGFHKIECTRWTHEVTQYAQYQSAVSVTFVPKRKRKARRFVDTYKPTTIVLEGHNHPDPPSAWKSPVVSGGCVVQEGRHSGFSSEWGNEFNAMIDGYIEESGAKVLLDVRGRNTMSPARTDNVVGILEAAKD